MTSAAVPITIGVILYGLGFFLALSKRLFLRRAIQTEGSVMHTEHVYEVPQGISTPFTIEKQLLMVDFLTRDGTHIVAKSLFSYSTWEVGKHLPLLYDPNNPHKVIIPSLEFWCLPVLFFLFGTFFFFSVYVLQ